MLQPPHIRARQRFLRRYLGPVAAGAIIGAGALYYFAAPTAPATTSVGSANCAARAADAAPVDKGAQS